MSYSITKPDPGPSPLIDVVQINTNFVQFEAAFNANHTHLNLANQGDHETIIMEKQTVDPTVSEDLAVLYAKNVTNNIGTQLQLFARITQFLPNGILNDPMQLTYHTVNTAGTITANGTQYQSFLPGGYVLYFGQWTNIAVQINLSPAPTKILAIAVEPATATATPAIASILTTSAFAIVKGSGLPAPTNPYSYSYMAIGLQ